MNILHTKLLIIPVIILLVLVLIYILITGNNKVSKNNPFLSFSPSPTINKLPQQSKVTSYPTIIPPVFTGAATELQIPQEELDLATQKYILRKKTPLKQNGFSIFFDYSTDLFNVILQEPKDVSQASFSAWLNKSYPSIPQDRFMIK